MTRALITYGGWDGHKPEVGAELMRTLLTESGVEVEVHDTLDVLLDTELMDSIDLLVPHWTMSRIEEAQEKALLEAVRGGTNLAGFHGGTGDAFRLAVEYQFVIGGQFICHPDGIKDYTVDIADFEHPITSGLPASFDMHSEQYYMHVDPAMHVLATTTFRRPDSAPWVDGVVMPVAWTKPYGDARVFYCSLGHDPAEYEAAAPRRLLQRGLAWAAGVLDAVPA